jgi:hypothetical protein
VYAFAPLFLVHLRSLSNREMDCFEKITERFRLRSSRMSPSVATLCRMTREMTASPISLEVFRRRWRLFRGTCHEQRCALPPVKLPLRELPGHRRCAGKSIQESACGRNML